jgi:hypothetical protein
VPFAPPLPNTPVAASLDADVDFVEKPTWGAFEDGIANVISVESERLTIVVKDQRSLSRHGPGRTLTLKLSGLEDPRLLNGVSPFEVARSIISRVLGVWSIPVALAKFAVSLEYVHTIFLGDYVQITDWLLPDGAGGRGLTNVVGQVVARSVDVVRGVVALEAIIYDHGNLAGYAPCVRVAALNGGRTVATIDTAYIAATGDTATLTDYAGSDRTDYEGVADDGGTGWFEAGDKVRLIIRDSTTLTVEDATILSVDTAAKTITFTGAVGAAWATALGAGDIVDIIPASYDTSGLSATQKTFGYVCDHNEPFEIGASGDPPQTWSP